MTPRFAPARADGLKPWLVSRYEWGRKTEHIAWAETRQQAVYQVKGRERNVKALGRRATSEDLARLAEVVE